MAVINFGNSSENLNYPLSRPTLDLNFAATKLLDPRITFSRSSTGTYVGADGLIQSAATNAARFDHNPTTGESLGLLVEEARTNLALHNNNVGDAIWVEQSTTKIPNALLAPDGTFTAALVKATTANATHKIRQDISTAQSALTFSIYVKAAGYTRIALNEQAQTGSSSAIINLADGSGATSGTVVSNAGNGWYRISWSSTFGSGLAKIFCVVIWPNDGSGDNPNSFNWTGDGQSGIYIWAAQVEAGSFPTSYIPTPATFTSRASTATYYDSAGVIQTAGIDVARSAAYFPDSNGVMRPAGLLLEAAGTNLVTYSQDLTTWGPINMSVSSNVSAAPDGTTTADKIIPNTSDVIHNIYAANTVSSITGTYTVSVFAKADGYNFVWLALDGASDGGVFPGGAGFSLVDGTYQLGDSTVSASSQKLGNGWYRLSVTGTTASTVSASPYIAPATGKAFSNVYFAGNGTSGVLIWGAQLETGSYPTSYIPTVDSTVTRSADVSSSATVTRSADLASITGTNFSSWYNQNAGTVLSVVKNVPFYGGFWYFGPTGAPRWWTRYELGNGVRTQAYDGSGGSGIVDIVVAGASTSSILPVVRHAVAIDNISQEHAGSANNSSTVVGSWDTILGVSSLQLGIRADAVAYLNGTISRFTYWPVRLPNATLQALTQ